ncbi:MAG: WYL domain-containing protein [Actinobacteria bacterium]|nr:WYL domain-containing protein [Actinomycetota bacterium]
MAVEEIIRRAIEDRAPLSLLYQTTGAAPRTVHPQVLFRAANGTLCLDCYQVGGATSSEERIPGWRQLDLDRITAAQLLDGSFERAPGLNLGAEKYAAGMIAHV